jgi:hypothetical protein
MPKLHQPSLFQTAINRSDTLLRYNTIQCIPLGVYLKAFRNETCLRHLPSEPKLFRYCATAMLRQAIVCSNADVFTEYRPGAASMRDVRFAVSGSGRKLLQAGG